MSDLDQPAWWKTQFENICAERHLQDKAKQVLEYLMVNRQGKGVATTVLMKQFYPGGKTNALSTTITRLRKDVAERLAISPRNYTVKVLHANSEEGVARPTALSNGPETAKLPHTETVQEFPALSVDLVVNQIKDGSCRSITLCVPCIIDLPELPLVKALNRGAQVNLLLSDPECAFIGLRGAALTREEAETKGVFRTPSQQVLQNLKGLRDLFAHRYLKDEAKDNLIVKLTKALMPVNYIQLDEIIYFIPFWNGVLDFEGLNFAAQADSTVGKFLAEQFRRLWDSAQQEDLSQPEPTATSNLALGAH